MEGKAFINEKRRHLESEFIHLELYSDRGVFVSVTWRNVPPDVTFNMVDRLRRLVTSLRASVCKWCGSIIVLSFLVPLMSHKYLMQQSHTKKHF